MLKSTGLSLFDWTVEGSAVLATVLRVVQLGMGASTRTVNIWFMLAFAALAVSYAAFGIITNGAALV